jgi:hypothetical protein
VHGRSRDQMACMPYLECHSWPFAQPAPSAINVTTISCSKSGLACSNCLLNHSAGSIVGPTAIAYLVQRVLWRELLEDRAVAVSAPDAMVDVVHDAS